MHDLRPVLTVDRQLPERGRVGRGRRVRLQAHGLATGRGRETQRVEADRRVLGILLEHGNEAMSADVEREAALALPSRPNSTVLSHDHAVGSRARDIGIAVDQGEPEAEVRSEALLFEVGRERRKLRGERGGHAEPLARRGDPDRLGDELRREEAPSPGIDGVVGPRQGVGGDTALVAPCAGEERGVPGRGLGGERRQRASPGPAVPQRPQVWHHPARNGITHDHGACRIDADQDRPTLPPDVAMLERRHRGPFRRLPGREPRRAEPRHGRRHAANEAIPLSAEEPLKVGVVVSFVLTRVGIVGRVDRREVGLEQRRHGSARLTQHGERHLDRIGHPGRGLGSETRLDLLAVAADQLTLPARMNAFLVGQLAVVIQDAVQRDVRIGDVMPQHRRVSQRSTAVARAERVDERRVLLGDPPRHPPLLSRLRPVLGQMGALVPRDRGDLSERIAVEEVVRELALAARVAPEIRVDRVLGQVVPVGGEQCLQLRRQRVYCPRVDDAVAEEPPGIEGGCGESENDREETESRVSHTTLLPPHPGPLPLRGRGSKGGRITGQSAHNRCGSGEYTDTERGTFQVRSRRYASV